MDIRFNNKTVVVIGGSTGIGAVVVDKFLASGAKVIFTGIEEIDVVDLDKYRHHCKDCVEYVQLDITEESDVEAFASMVKVRHGGCDVLFNNAGILASGLLHETPSKDWLRVMDVNVNGLFYTSKYFIPHMLEKGKGAIVNTASMSGLQADYGFGVYNASKGAVSNLTRNMAIDYAEYNIRVNAVCPGSVRTPMYDRYADVVGGTDILELGTGMAYPMGRIGKPEEIANVVLFLASDEAGFMTGANVVVDGGITAHTGAQHHWDVIKILNEYNKNKEL